MQGLEIGQPGEGHVIFGPGAGDGNGYFVFIIAIERPVIDGGQLLHDIHRMFRAFCFLF